MDYQGNNQKCIGSKKKQFLELLKNDPQLAQKKVEGNYYTELTPSEMLLIKEHYWLQRDPPSLHSYKHAGGETKQKKEKEKVEKDASADDEGNESSLEEEEEEEESYGIGEAGETLEEAAATAARIKEEGIQLVIKIMKNPGDYALIVTNWDIIKNLPLEFQIMAIEMLATIQKEPERVMSGPDPGELNVVKERNRLLLSMTIGIIVFGVIGWLGKWFIDDQARRYEEEEDFEMREYWHSKASSADRAVMNAVVKYHARDRVDPNFASGGVLKKDKLAEEALLRYIDDQRLADWNQETEQINSRWFGWLVQASLSQVGLGRKRPPRSILPLPVSVLGGTSRRQEDVITQDPTNSVTGYTPDRQKNSVLEITDGRKTLALGWWHVEDEDDDTYGEDTYEEHYYEEDTEQEQIAPPGDGGGQRQLGHPDDSGRVQKTPLNFTLPPLSTKGVTEGGGGEQKKTPFNLGLLRDPGAAEHTEQSSSESDAMVSGASEGEYSSAKSVSTQREEHAQVALLMTKIKYGEQGADLDSLSPSELRMVIMPMLRKVEIIFRERHTGSKDLVKGMKADYQFGSLLATKLFEKNEGWTTALFARLFNRPELIHGSDATHALEIIENLVIKAMLNFNEAVEARRRRWYLTVLQTIWTVIGYTTLGLPSYLMRALPGSDIQWKNLMAMTWKYTPAVYTGIFGYALTHNLVSAFIRMTYWKSSKEVWLRFASNMRSVGIAYFFGPMAMQIYMVRQGFRLSVYTIGRLWLGLKRASVGLFNVVQKNKGIFKALGAVAAPHATLMFAVMETLAPRQVEALSSSHAHDE